MKSRTVVGEVPKPDAPDDTIIAWVMDQYNNHGVSVMDLTKALGLRGQALYQWLSARQVVIRKKMVRYVEPVSQ